jgi:hypothetical protein
MLLGISLLSLGAVGFYLNSLLLILMLLPGLFFIMIGVTSLGRSMPRRGRVIGITRQSATLSMNEKSERDGNEEAE